MGVAALGMMMGQMQEANKDDYNSGAMLKQVMGTTAQGQQQADASQNQGVGSIIQNIVGGGQQQPPQGGDAGGMPQLGGLGGMIQALMTQPKQSDDEKQKPAQANNTPYQSAGYSPGNGLTSSNWSY